MEEWVCGFFVVWFFLEWREVMEEWWIKKNQCAHTQTHTGKQGDTEGRRLEEEGSGGVVEW